MKACDVVVIDDNARWAVHLWLFLARRPAFGVGDVEAAQASAQLGGPRPLVTPGGAVRIWWIDAKGPCEKPRQYVGWQAQLGDVLGKITASCAECDVRFFVDVRSRHPGYDVHDVLDLLGASGNELRNRSTDGNIWLVSSYDRTLFHCGQRLAVREKTYATFRDLAPIDPDGGTRDRKDNTSPESNVVHVLVSGAGFEFRQTVGLGSFFGVPLTTEILRRVLVERQLEPTSFDPSEFPIPAIYRKGIPMQRATELRLFKAASNRDLDEYWNALLQLEFEDKGWGSDPKTGDRETAFDGARASDSELRLRESFREKMQDHDWGQLPQCLEAAELFRLWLTTNYTRFTDRALALQRAQGGSSSRATAEWRKISISTDAARHRRTLMHLQHPGELAGRFVFKLHGDISHVTTMAIAGYDKGVYSLLSTPMDHLHEVYLAAEQHLRFVLLGQRPSALVWHIVGHSLWDRLLRRLMARLCAESIPLQCRHYFLLVCPDDEEQHEHQKIAHRLLGDLSQPWGKAGQQVDPAGFEIVPVVAAAADYVVTLRRSKILEVDAADLERSKAAWQADLGVAAKGA